MDCWVYDRGLRKPAGQGIMVHASTVDSILQRNRDGKSPSRACVETLAKAAMSVFLHSWNGTLDLGTDRPHFAQAVKLDPSI